MTEQRGLIISFPEYGRVFRAVLLDRLAPATCAAVLQLAAKEASMEALQAIFAGRELGIHVPPELVEGLPGHPFEQLAPENQSVFPAPGDLMYQYCPPRMFAGDDEPVYDISICYGPDTRLFMPWGWSPANRFAQVVYADREMLAEVGGKVRRRGATQVILKPGPLVALL